MYLDVERVLNELCKCQTMLQEQRLIFSRGNKVKPVESRRWARPEIGGASALTFSKSNMPNSQESFGGS